MAHHTELIAKIVRLLHRDYPPETFEYVREKRLLGSTKNVQPDIQIIRPDGCVVCVVEIGYTRPEKLTYYRCRSRIPDVRWYAKDGKLHFPGATAEGAMGSTTIARETPSSAHKFCVVPVADLECPLCLEEIDDFTGIAVAGDVMRSFLLSNAARRAVIGFCDECGECFVTGDEICVRSLRVEGSREADIDFYNFENILYHAYRCENRLERDTLGQCERITDLSWEEVRAWVHQQFGGSLTVLYESLHPFKPNIY